MIGWPNASRRTLLQGVALAAGVASVKPAGADARDEKSDTFWTGEYRAKKGDVSLYMFRKRLAAPAPNETPLPVLFLVHGSSVSSRPSFDLATPGLGEYSLMNVFARYGYDVWTMDFEGYGRSTATSGNSDIKSGVADLAAAAIVLERETGVKKYHFAGESSGALRAAAFAVAHPDRVDRLILQAHTYTGKGSPTLGKRAEQMEFYKTHNRRPRDRAMIKSIFTRDKPGTSDPRLGDILADAELVHGDSVPTGTYYDMTANLPVVEPEKVVAPTLLVRGEYDGIATMEDLLDFFGKLPNADRQFVVLPGAAHSLITSNNRRGLWHAMQSFLTMPAVGAA